jgi:hypothetical protein
VINRKKFATMFILLVGCSLLFPAMKVRAAQDSPAVQKGTITGVIKKKDGGPLAQGQILFFNAAAGPPPDPEKFDRTPDYVRVLDENGSFTVSIPTGSYYLGASLKASGEPIGPPKEGDFVWRGLDANGKLKLYSVPGGGRLDIGTIAEAIPLKMQSVLHRAVTTAIEGSVVDTDGNPVPDVVVVAFTGSTLRGKPKFVSEKTDQAGKYVLRIVPGTYYLRARNEFASGPPEPGQIVGFYGEGSPSSITIKAGEILRDVNFQVILFPGRGPLSGQQ